MSAFPAAALRFLRCPVCGTEFSPAERSLRCLNGHSYDVARQGYVNLLPGGARPGTADTAEMVAAREAFLLAGHFAGLRDLVSEMAVRALEGRSTGEDRHVAGRDEGGRSPGCIVEAGAGTGYYLAGVVERFPGRTGLALDISKFAARRAARAHARVAAVVCDAWQTLPVADGAASVVLDVFAPRNPGEFRRVLEPAGGLVVAVPSTRHLQELVRTLGLLNVDEHKPERLERALEDHFILDGRSVHERRVVLPPGDVAALAAMGPSAHHLPPDGLARRLAALGERIEVTISVNVTTYTPRTPAGDRQEDPPGT